MKLKLLPIFTPILLKKVEIYVVKFFAKLQLKLIKVILKMPLRVGEPCSHEKISDDLIAQEHFEHLENEVATLQVS